MQVKSLDPGGTTQPNTQAGACSTIDLANLGRSFDTGDTTRPNSLVASDSPDDPENPPGDFARLMPRSKEAKLAFNELYLAMKKDESLTDWHRRFIHYRSLPEPLEEREASYSSMSDFSAGTPGNEDSVCIPVHLGFWRLNMQLPPHILNAGWSVGKGRWSKTSDARGCVDILLTNDKSEKSIRGIHFRFVHNLASRRLILVANQSLKLNGQHIAREEKRVLPEGDSHIALGAFEYLFTWVPIDSISYRNQLDDLAAQVSYSGELPSQYISPTPQLDEIKLQNKYYLTPSFAVGSSCTMYAGVDNEGRPYAVKKMVERYPSNDNRNHASAEVKILQALHHPRISRLIEFITIDPVVLSGIYDCYIISQPLITTSLRSLLKTEVSTKSRVILLMQILEGVAFLHKQGCMHRDLKLDNIIATPEPPNAIIIDFGCATWDKESYDHDVGTIRYLAPEVLDLKYHQEQPIRRPYTSAADIWTVGQTFYEFICRHQFQHTHMTSRVYRNVLSKVHWHSNDQHENTYLKPMFDLIFQMLAWDAQDRITAIGALAMASENGLYLPESVPVPDGRKRRREPSPAS